MTTVKFTANDWELYTVSSNCNEAARALNAALKKALKKLPELLKTHKPEDAASIVFCEVMSPVHEKWSSKGAADSEPRWFAKGKLLAYAKALAVLA